ncbi:MAG: sodium:alanine symporter family protein [Oscillospiraceae bacterium]|nr:sodium:alanine symporter family protein [Oscillospiraceae bacterium]MBQ6901862.1 sodium:alanine symporter family protein [Oscillospiraceae bacterium]
MENLEQILLKVMNTINTYMADYVLIILLVGIGLYFTVRTRFVQVRCFGEGMKKVFGDFSLRGGKQKGGMSSFQALATAIAGQVGTGNIVGASGAILTGGPGAIFWMWIIAFLGMATIYAEAVLAQETRVVDADGTVHGGPIYYIKRAFSGKFGTFLAGFFAVAIIISLGFIGGMVQSNSIGATINTAFGIPTWITGLLLAAVVAFIIIGGAQRIAATAEKIVPVMAVLYIVGGLIVIAVNITKLPEAVGMIFKYAFEPQALIGGGVGYALKTAISQGAKRGLFSNEAGMGSTPHAHAMANVKTPHEQGVVAMIGVFLDTFVVLTMTALVVITCTYASGGALAGADGASYASMLAASGIDKTNVAQMSFGSVFGTGLGNAYVAICLMFFAFTTIISWNLFGKINFNYLFGKKSTIVYSVIAVVFVFLGAVVKENELVWVTQDTFNQFMVIPNVMALAALAKIVAKSSDKKLK